MPRSAVRLDLLPEAFALVQLAATAPVPDWAWTAPRFCSVTRTGDELSIAVDASVVPDELEAQRAYRAFRVQGPMSLDVVGILAAVATPLAAAAVPIFAIATYNTDYILVKGTDLARAEAALRAAGHEIVALAAST